MSTRNKAPKFVQMSFRMTEECRDLLIALAGFHRRSQANMLEMALLDFAARTGLEMPSAEIKRKATKKKAAKKR